jgi:hypothetical protein
MPGGTSLIQYAERHAKDTNNCPDICQAVINLVDNGTVSLNDVTLYTSCDAPTPPSPTVNSNVLLWLAVAGGAALVLGAGVFAFYKVKKTK